MSNLRCYHCDGPISGDFAICIQCSGQIHPNCDWIPCNPGRNPKGRATPKENDVTNKD